MNITEVDCDGDGWEEAFLLDGKQGSYAEGVQVIDISDEVNNFTASLKFSTGELTVDTYQLSFQNGELVDADALPREIPEHILRAAEGFASHYEGAIPHNREEICKLGRAILDLGAMAFEEGELPAQNAVVINPLGQPLPPRFQPPRQK